MAKALFRHEKKAFGLRRASEKRLRTSAEIANIVEVVDNARRGYCFVNFSDTFVTELGKKLPYGVSHVDPIRLRVVATPEINGQRWYQVKCRYLKRDASRLLWQTDQRPAWIGRVHEK